METLLIIALVVLILFGIIVIGTFTYVNIRGVKYYKEADRMVSENEKPHQQPLDEDEAVFHLAPLSNLDEEYMNLFSNPPMDKAARRGKSAYLRDAYHERIRQIVNALNIEGVNISTYVDMVLTDHMMRYETQIDNLLHNCYGKTIKKRKQWQPS